MISVLIVEDDFRVAGLHREFVERCKGFQIAGVALTASQAITMNRELVPDLILLDLYLPDEHGIDIVATLRSDSGADVIVITAARDVPNIRAAMQHGALFYLVKPFRFAAFRERLEAFARLRATLIRSPELSQTDIDNAFGTLRTARPDLPKGLSAQTLYAIERTLQEADQSLSSEAVAHLTGVSRVTARRYLIFLVESGRAEVHSEYGTPGRPMHLYAPLGDSNQD
ncbi:MAG: two-component system response regulator [Actinobacteria bacterium]|nr:MAG: two-component system response regulator [Actinomycetota bacterium]